MSSRADELEISIWICEAEKIELLSVSSTVLTANAIQTIAIELVSLPSGAALLALGTIAHLAVLRAMSLQNKSYKFIHAVRHALPNGIMLYDSYHCSRYNT